jgi:hypothetical protein
MLSSCCFIYWFSIHDDVIRTFLVNRQSANEPLVSSSNPPEIHTSKRFISVNLFPPSAGLQTILYDNAVVSTLNQKLIVEGICFDELLWNYEKTVWVVKLLHEGPVVQYHLILCCDKLLLPNLRALENWNLVMAIVFLLLDWFEVLHKVISKFQIFLDININKLLLKNFFLLGFNNNYLIIKSSCKLFDLNRTLLILYSQQLN